MIWLTLVACASQPDDSSLSDSSAAVQANPASAEAGWLRGDLHFHTNYSDDALEQGGDWMGPALDIADAYQDPAWTEAFPETARDRLHFVAAGPGAWTGAPGRRLRRDLRGFGARIQRDSWRFAPEFSGSEVGWRAAGA